MKNIIIFLCLCTICMCRLHAADSSRADSLLLKLDQAIKERPVKNLLLRSDVERVMAEREK